MDWQWLKDIARPRSPRSAACANPWWFIGKRALCGKVIVAGPFFTELAADMHLASNRSKYGNAHVFAFEAPAGGEYAKLVQAIRLINKPSQK